MKKIIFEKEYRGFESTYDLDRDIYECWDPRFTPKAKGLKGEFQGTLKVTIEYIPEDCCGGSCDE